MPEPLRPWEVHGTREYSAAEAEANARVAHLVTDAGDRPPLNFADIVPPYPAHAPRDCVYAVSSEDAARVRALLTELNAALDHIFGPAEGGIAQ